MPQYTGMGKERDRKDPAEVGSSELVQSQRHSMCLFFALVVLYFVA